jgi:TonB family protein
MMPAAKSYPHLQTIQVSFYNPSEFPSNSQKLSAAKSTKPNKIFSKDNFKAMTVQPAQVDKRQKSAVLKDSETIIFKTVLSDKKFNAAKIQDVADMPAKNVGNQILSQGILPDAAEGNIHPSIVEYKFGDTGSPTFIHQEIPVYPILARRLGKEGKVVFKLLINVNGDLKNIEVIEAAGFGFTEAAIKAVKKSTFAPGYRNGERVWTQALLPVRFQLQ